jgi:hypothetical protein
VGTASLALAVTAAPAWAAAGPPFVYEAGASAVYQYATNPDGTLSPISGQIGDKVSVWRR